MATTIAVLIPLSSVYHQHRRLTLLSAEILKLGGSVDWLKKSDLWEDEYYGMFVYNTIEPIGARDIVTNLWSERTYLHVQLNDISLDERSLRVLDDDRTVSVSMSYCKFGNAQSEGFNNVIFASLEGDTETLSMLESLKKSKLPLPQRHQPRQCVPEHHRGHVG